MKAEYVNLEEYGLEFKHIISGPAPVGRILNYVKYAGQGILKHKNGNRDLHMTNNIGSAWCTELMVGLGLIYYYDIGSPTYFQVSLTKEGKQLYSLIQNSKFDFDEGSNYTKCKEQLLKFSKEAYNYFKKLFVRSAICKNLLAYIVNTGNNTFSKSTFFDEYFGFFILHYTGETYVFDPTSTAATTGGNRVPSLTQLCGFFDLCYVESGRYVFDVAGLTSDEDIISNFVDVSTILDDLKEEEKKNLKLIDDLAQRYGIDGTVAREIITRNSSVQDIFRNNLIAKHGCKCMLCGKDTPEVLVASHIKPAAICNVYEKADFENGLLLCANHDKLFDRYLISFDFSTGKIILSEEIKDKIADYGLTEDYCLPEELLTENRRQYLLQHNMAFYEKHKE